MTIIAKAARIAVRIFGNLVSRFKPGYSPLAMS
jgi:hypothetical protein